MRIARVFPRKTAYTPDDDGVYFSEPDMFLDESITEAMVSCSFTWDKPRAEALAEAWGRRVRTTLGGPAYDDPGGDFNPGVFIKHGYVFTSRGCCNKCEWCFVAKREGCIRCLPICDGTRILDSNLLACPREHIEAVFAMLHRQKGKVGLHGGFDIRLVKDWHIDLLAGLRKKLERIYVAFDSEPVRDLCKHSIDVLRDGAGLSLAQLRCFVLVGYGDDTIQKAEERCKWVLSQGAIPFASYYRGPEDLRGTRPKEWNELVKRWAWMPGIFARIKREEPAFYAKVKEKRNVVK